MSSDYNSQNCNQRQVCNILDEKHSTGLHSYKISKKNRVTDVDDSEKNDSSLACETSKMTSNFVDMCVVLVKEKSNQTKKKLKTYAKLEFCSRRASVNSELAQKVRKEGIMATTKFKTLSGKKIKKLKPLVV